MKINRILSIGLLLMSGLVQARKITVVNSSDWDVTVTIESSDSDTAKNITTTVAVKKGQSVTLDVHRLLVSCTPSAAGVNVDTEKIWDTENDPGVARNNYLKIVTMKPGAAGVYYPGVEAYYKKPSGMD